MEPGEWLFGHRAGRMALRLRLRVLSHFPRVVLSRPAGALCLWRRWQLSAPDSDRQGGGVPFLCPRPPC